MCHVVSVQIFLVEGTHDLSISSVLVMALFSLFQYVLGIIFYFLFFLNTRLVSKIAPLCRNQIHPSVQENLQRLGKK